MEEDYFEVEVLDVDLGGQAYCSEVVPGAVFLVRDPGESSICLVDRFVFKRPFDNVWIKKDHVTVLYQPCLLGGE